MDLSRIYALMAEHLVALVSQSTGSPNADALKSMQAKLDAALAASSQQRFSTLVLEPNQTSVLQGATSVYAGMDCNTGRLITGLDYLAQRVADALLTPQASQVLLRARGSRLYLELDKPLNDAGRLGWTAAIAEALAHPLAGVADFKLSAIYFLTPTTPGQLRVKLAGLWQSQPVEVIV